MVHGNITIKGNRSPISVQMGTVSKKYRLNKVILGWILSTPVRFANQKKNRINYLLFLNVELNHQFILVFLSYNFKSL